MANLLGWLGNGAKRLGHTVNNDVFQPINRDVVKPTLNVASRSYDQANPLDSGRSFTNRTPQVNTPIAKSTYNFGKGIVGGTGIPYFIRTDITNPAKQIAAQVTGNQQAYNNIEADQRSLLTPKKILGNAAGAGLTLAGPGISRGIESGLTAAFAPKLAMQLAAKTSLGLGEEAAAPALEALLKYGGGAVSGAAIGAPFNVASLAQQGAPLNKQTITKAAGQGAAFGAGLGVGIPLAEAGVKGIANAGAKAIDSIPKVSADYNPETNKTFDANKYVTEQTQLQKDAQGKTSKLAQAKNEFATKGLDALSPIEKPVERAAGGRNNTVSLRDQLDRSLRSDTIAGQYAKDAGLHKIVNSVKDTKAFDQYVIAKHAADLEANGIKTGRDLGKDAQLVQSLGPQYENQSKALGLYNNKLLDKTVDYGLVSRETANYLKQKYPNYVPFDRIFSDSELQGKGNGSGPASLSTQTVIQRIKGSDRQIHSPLESILAKTHDVIAQGERNQAAKAIADTRNIPGNPLGIKPLRTAEDVLARQDAYKQLSELKPARNYLQKAISDTQNQIRDVTSKNKQAAGVVAAKVNDLTERIKATTAEGQPLTGVGAKKFPEFINSAGRGSIEDLANAYLQIQDPAFKGQVDKVLRQDLKLGSLADTLSQTSDQLNTVMTKRGELFNEAKLHADAQAKGLDTISTINNGIKEIYQTTPEVAQAAKSLNKQQLGLVGKILSYPTRVLRLGATGANLPFAAANVVKDTASSFINSQHPLRASVANPKVFLQALSAAFHHGGENYSELVREGAGGTSFDIARNSAPDTLAKIRSERNIGTKVLYTARHPSELLRAVEDTIGRSEEFGRAKEYFGNKEAALKEGKTSNQAVAYGADAARNNTVNFARAGEYGRVLNSVLPYFNAGIQGSRTLLRNIRDRPVQTGAKIVISASFPVAAATAWNLSDPKRRAAYNDIQDYEKQGNIIIIPPNPKKDANGRWNAIKIPVSQEIANVNNVVRNGVEAMQKDKGINFPALAGNLTGTATSLNTQSPRQLAGQVIPQAIKPGIESLTNQNLFTGNKIVPDNMKNLDAKDQYGQNTSGTARVLGGATNISPYMIDNTIRTSLGGLGQTGVNAADNALAKLGVIKPEEIKGKSITSGITGRFSGAQGASQYAPIDKALKDNFDKLKATSGYKTLSSDDKAKALNRLQNDVVTAVKQQTDAKNATGQYAPNYAGKQTKLSKRQAGLLDGTTDITSYLTTQAQKPIVAAVPKTPKVKTAKATVKKSTAKVRKVAKPKIPSMKITSIKTPKLPKISIKKAVSFKPPKTRKLSVSKIPKISATIVKRKQT